MDVEDAVEVWTELEAGDVLELEPELVEDAEEVRAELEIEDTVELEGALEDDDLAEL